MNNYKFYTPMAVAEQLLTLLPERKYRYIIDICCGSWNLLKAAKQRYPYADLTGIDIDEKAIEDCIPGSLFLAKDGRIFAEMEKKNGKRYDLILSNPPFGYIPEEACFWKNIDEEKVLPNLLNRRYENEMLQANLLLAGEDSILLFILPSTFVEGKANKSVRETLAHVYDILGLVKLPVEIFGSHRISTYAIIMQMHNNQEKDTPFFKMEEKGNEYQLSCHGTIPYVKVLAGNWLNENDTEKKNIAFEYFRGNITSGHMSTEGEKVLHCSNQVISNRWTPGVRYCKDAERLQRCHKAQKGDIVINRIGKYAGYWTVCKEEVYISDCLIAFRAKDGSSLYSLFCKHSEDGRVCVPLKGVSVRYISAEDVTNILYT